MTIPQSQTADQKLLRSKLFWVGILYFAEGFPLGMFYDVFPVHFRTQGVELWKIGFMSLLGLAWTLKFLWAPAVDHYRHHRRWMFGADIAMAFIMAVFAWHNGFGPWVWWAIGLFTLMSATNDVAIDGYTIEMLNKRELGLANGLRIGFYRVGMLASGFVLMLSDLWGWGGTYLAATLLFVVIGLACLLAPREVVRPGSGTLSIFHELRALLVHPAAFLLVMLFLLGVVWLIDQSVNWSQELSLFWPAAWLVAATASVGVWVFSRASRKVRAEEQRTPLTEGPMFGTLLAMLQRPYIVPVIVFVLIFKLGDSAMGFMIKPFWVDAGFSAGQIGLVSVNIGLGLSIAGGIVGGWYTDRAGIFRALWVLGLWQAFSNLGYAYAADALALDTGAELTRKDHWLMYGASAVESFTGGLGTAAFLAFLMAVVNKQHSATEYAILSSLFALSRSVAGWAGGFGADSLGYADYFLLTFFLAFPAYLLLPWARRMMRYAERQKEFGQQ
ncbi:MAG: MFS transporter [Gammaproteobacteria bacterium]|jgi:PAT family beta-lactamase induction signal transducer AmpG